MKLDSPLVQLLLTLVTRARDGRYDARGAAVRPATKACLDAERRTCRGSMLVPAALTAGSIREAISVGTVVV